MPKTVLEQPQAQKPVQRQASEPKKEDRRELVRDLFKRESTNWVTLAKTLASVYDSDEYRKWGFVTFEEYVATDLKDDIEYRIAMLRVQNGRVLNQLNLTPESVGKIGWVKFKELTYILKADMSSKQVEEWLDKAKKSSLQELRDFIKSVRLQQQDIGKIVTLTFKLLNAQADAVEVALKHAGKLIESDDPCRQLEYVVQDYFVHNVETTEPLPQILKKMVPEDQIAKAKQKAPRKEAAHKGKSIQQPKKKAKAKKTPAKKKKK